MTAYPRSSRRVFSALSTFDAASLEELSTVLVKARIARGWTQRQLAEALGMAEQQIQRYEANDYRHRRRLDREPRESARLLTAAIGRRSARRYSRPARFP